MLVLIQINRRIFERFRKHHNMFCPVDDEGMWAGGLSKYAAFVFSVISEAISLAVTITNHPTLHDGYDDIDGNCHCH